MDDIIDLIGDNAYSKTIKQNKEILLAEVTKDPEYKDCRFEDMKYLYQVEMFEMIHPLRTKSLFSSGIEEKVRKIKYAIDVRKYGHDDRLMSNKLKPDEKANIGKWMTYIQYIGPPNLSDLTHREKVVRAYGWSFPSKRELDLIKTRTEGKSILEIGCGKAFYSFLLKLNGCINITCSDIGDPETKNVDANAKTTNKKFMPIDIIDAINAVEKYHTDVLLIVWPNYFLAEVVKKFTGDMIIYIGEGDGGCCAGSDFFDTVDSEGFILDYYERADLSWSCINTYTHIFTRNK
jgi:2-polyprenyl-3-methyl-5-hydroxy-6-metoxy-1,4-benzoquinol methylase